MQTANQQIIEWADRHGIKGTFIDIQCAFEDAQALIQPAQEPELITGDSAVAVGNLIYALNAWKATTSHTAPPAFATLVTACSALAASVKPEQQQRPHIGWMARRKDGHTALLTDLEIDSSAEKWTRQFKLYAE